MNCISVFYQNIRGLKTKTHEVYSAILNSEFDIIVLTETWLCESILNNEIIDKRYVVFRRDRESSILRTKHDGGGVLIAVSKKLKSYRVMKWESDYEDMWINIDFKAGNPNFTLSICGVYLPSPLNYECLKSFCDNVSRVSVEQSNTILIGDFNLSDIMWTEQTSQKYLIPVSNSGKINEYFIDFIAENRLYQFNQVRNPFNKTLDLILSNKESTFIINEVRESPYPLSHIDRHHPPLEISIHFTPVSHLETNINERMNFYNADYSVIIEEIEKISWNEIFITCGDVDEMLKVFYCKLREIIGRHIRKYKTGNSKYPRWFSKDLIKRLKEKNKYRNLYNKYKNPLDEISFKLLRKRCETLINSCYKNHIKNVEENIISNPKYFWSYLKEIRNNKSEYPSYMTLNAQIFSNGTDICNSFAKHFSSIYSDYPIGKENKIPNIECVGINQTLSNIHISVEEVESKLKKLDSNKSAGPDNIPPFFARKCAAALARPLSIIYNASLKEGFFPSAWKEARVVPVFKSGDRTDITKYRPISILSVFPKVFEAIICPIINWHMKSILTDRQHGFLRGRSTESNLCEYIDNLCVSVDKNLQVDAIYTDFSKAFDVVNHSILIKKLECYGFHSSFLKWVFSYLHNRKLKVVINGFQSEAFIAYSGVPQGSHLGPTLFNIFINDVVNCFLNSDVLLFADDLKLFKEIKTVNDGNLLQNDINRLVSWCELNNVILNHEKCYQISFNKKIHPIFNEYKINDFVIKKTNVIRDLGILIDCKLSFTTHMDEVIKKSLKFLGLIKRVTKTFKNKKSKVILFNSFILSNLEYCSSVWNPHYQTHINRIERVQKKFLKYLYFNNNKIHRQLTYIERLDNCNMISLNDRRALMDMCLLHKIVNNKISSNNLLGKISYVIPRPNSRIRNYSLFKTRYCRTNVGLSAPINRTLKTYNVISKLVDLDIFNDSYTTFKNKIKKHFYNKIKITS